MTQISNACYMKAVVIIDGLNFYHALKDLGTQYTNLDMAKLSRRLLPKSVDNLQLFYFTSAPEHLGNEALKNHGKYTARLKSSGVQVIEGRFQRITSRCKICGAKTLVHREKETDVSIALKIVEAAGHLETSEILIFSADSDLSPALKLAKRTNPKIKISVSQTYTYLRKSHSALMEFADEKHELRPGFIHNYQFDT